MGRVRFLPEFIGRVHPRTGTPINALLLNLLIGTLSILFLDTGRLITDITHPVNAALASRASGIVPNPPMHLPKG